MNKSSLRIIYFTLVLVMLSLFIASPSFLEVGKLFLLVVLSYMLFDISTARRESSVYHQFNILFAIALVVFVIYSLAFKGDLYPHVRLEFFLGALIGFAMSMYYNPKSRKTFLPPKPVERKVVATKPVPAKRVTRTVKKTSTKKSPKKVTKKKTAKKIVKKSVKKTTKKKVAKKKVTKKKVAKKSSKKNVSADRNLISFSKDHEVAYLLRKHKKRITKANKEILIKEGKKFKSMKSFKPYNRESFYAYMKKYKVLSKLK